MKSLARLTTLVMILFLTACNMPGVRPNTGLSTADQAATIVAATVDAVKPTAAVTPFASPKPAFTAVASATATAGKVSIQITSNSNCRSGPGASFKNVTSFVVGTNLDIIGKNTENNYWLIKIPDSAETCWVWGDNGTVKGDTASLPEPTPVTPVVQVPVRPGSLHYNYSCTPSSISVSLDWADASDNETGYHVYRSDTQIADLPANSTSYDDTVNSGPPQDLQYSVAAYNASGESTRRVAQFTACP
jgi:hypothetical protein